MEITTYRRHSADCIHKDDRYHPRCGCPLWFQFNWSQADTTLDGKKLRQGQNKWSAETRIWSEAQSKAKRLDSDLQAVLEGKPVRQNVTVKAAVDDWLEFRTKNGLTSSKGKLMGDKLVAWCDKNGIVLLTAITTERAMKFRMSLPFRTGDSNSLSVHWAVIGGFFSWAVGMGYLEKTPIPNTRLYPQFRIRYQKKEVVPPSKQGIEKVLGTATGRVANRIAFYSSNDDVIAGRTANWQQLAQVFDLPWLATLIIAVALGFWVFLLVVAVAIGVLLIVDSQK